MAEVPAPRLRDLIAEALYGTSANELAAVCDGLGMPPADAGAYPMSSKRRYVRNRLLKASKEELRTISRRVAEDYPDDALVEALAAAGEVAASPRHIIFATLAKPDLVLTDALFNEVAHVGDGDALIYDTAPPDEGLTLRAIKAWWSARHGKASLYRRLEESLSAGSSDAERTLFEVYYREVTATGGDDLPALLPQVWLHYDPRTARERRNKVLPRQRIDFLMVMKGRRRIVLEVDGKHHFADESGRASLTRYAEMVAADRELRLAGYEVFRFGANELVGRNGAARARDFLLRLLEIR